MFYQRKQGEVIILLAFCNNSEADLKWHKICQNLSFQSVFAGLRGAGAWILEAQILCIWSVSSSWHCQKELTDSKKSVRLLGEGVAPQSVLPGWGSGRAIKSKHVCLEEATQPLLFFPVSQTIVRTSIKQIESTLQFTNSFRCWGNNEDWIRPDPSLTMLLSLLPTI